MHTASARSGRYTRSVNFRPALVAILLLGAGCGACSAKRHQRGPSPSPPSSSIGELTATAPKAVKDPLAESAASRCNVRLQELEAAPALPGDPPFEARRSETFARAKADPVLLVRAPVAAGLTSEGAWRRRSILDAPDPVKALYEAYPSLSKRRDVAREALLTDGYLYAASPALAAALSSLTRPEDLFLTPEIWIERGATIFRAVRGAADGAPAYVHADGPSAGQRVKLLLFDRVSSTKEMLSSPLHRDLSAAQNALGFERMRVRHLSEDVITADLLYGDVWVPTALHSEGARLSFDCEAVPVGRERDVERSRDAARRLTRVLERLRAIIDQQVEEGLPFDEPKTEVGQQDGKLRQEWSWAYRYGQTRFTFNDDHYRVFDGQGRPRVPQVCIDFVTDTFERASGSWYRPRGEPRERTPGRLDFGALGIDNERSVESFVEFAKAHEAWFEVLELPDEERVPYVHRDQFFAHLATHGDRYRPGDIVTIYGLRADGKMHYHSFFVYSADPVTGTPSLVAANAGRPRVRPFESEMLSAPLRSIRARIRPRLEWLESVTAVPEPAPAAPPAPIARARGATI
jgi:hypothetical protein